MFAPRDNRVPRTFVSLDDCPEGQYRVTCINYVIVNCNCVRFLRFLRKHEEV